MGLTDADPMEPADGQGPRAPMPRPLFAQPRFLGSVVIGGALGTLVRYLLEEANPATPGRWPATTFWINVSGSLVLGALLTGLARTGPDAGWRRVVRLGVGTGFCGGFTTYSTFIIEVDSLARGGHGVTAAGYAVLSILAGITAAALGMATARRLASSRSAAGAPR